VHGAVGQRPRLGPHRLRGLLIRWFAARAPTGPLADALTERGWPRGTDAAHDLWLPTPRVDRHLDRRLAELTPPPGAVLAAIPGLASITRKRRLHATLQPHHPGLMPPGWLPDQAPPPPGPLVAKDDRRQRRQGISFDTPPTAPPQHLLLQRRIESTRVHGRAVSLRAWLLLVRDDALTAWLFDDAALLYAPAGDWITRSRKPPRGAPSTLSAWRPELLPSLQRALAAVAALASPAATRPAHRCIEWLGADFVVDPVGRPWLLEINRKPLMRPRFKAELPLRIAVLRGALDAAKAHPPRRYVALGSWPLAHA